MTSTRCQLNKIVQSHCIELFHDYGLEVESIPDDNSWMEFIAVIGYTSNEMRGFLGIATGERVVEETHRRLNLGDATELMLADWLGELINQLMGRVKTELSEFGLNIYMATPVVLRGASLRVASRGDDVSYLSMASEAGPLSIWLDARYDPDLTLEAVAPMPDDLKAPKCGEGAFFF